MLQIQTLGGVSGRNALTIHHESGLRDMEAELAAVLGDDLPHGSALADSERDLLPMLITEPDSDGILPRGSVEWMRSLAIPSSCIRLLRNLISDSSLLKLLMQLGL